MNEIAARIVVPSDHPSLAGHFPEHPIVPGVVLLDAVLEAIQSARGRHLRLASIVSTKFLRAIDPGTTLDLQVAFAPDTGGWKARFTARLQASTVLEGSFLLFDRQGERT